MTSRSDGAVAGRACVRDCTVKDMHFATCPSFGAVDAEGGCRGCAPVSALDGMLICDRCFRSLRRLLDDAPDLIAHLRSIADPTKARVYDRVLVSSSRPEMSAPVAADLLDASNDIAVTLRNWATRVEHPEAELFDRHLQAGIEAALAHDEMRRCAEVILEDLERIANDKDQILALGEALLTRSRTTSPAFWSIADVAARWPIDDSPRWAEAPCPGCDLMTVRVLPARRRGGRTRYVCRECAWEADDLDDGGLWAVAFAELVPAVSA